jgi:hypothetical protein
VLLLSQKYLWPLNFFMALKTCVTNNNPHPKGFFFCANLLCHTHACCSYVSFGLEDDSCQFARNALSLFITKTQFTLEK